MEIKKFSNIRKIKHEFEKLDKNCRPFQKYDVVKNIFSFAYYIEPLFYNIKKMRKFAFYVVYDKGNPVLIAPGTIGKGVFYVMGDKEWDYVDLIYSTRDEVYLSQVVSFLFKHLKDKESIREISWRYLEERSTMYKALTILKDSGLQMSSVPDVSVNIALPGSYDDYFNSLGKSTKQNCRTAYNRLNREGKKYALETYFASDGKKLTADKKSRKLYKKCLTLYLIRQKERYHQPFLYRIRNRFYDYATRSIPLQYGFMSVLFLDGEIAAFMMGYQDEAHDSVVLPKLAIVDKFNFYSPGVILINETAKKLIEKNKFLNIDLCEGDEKYKFSMGGEKYLTQKIKIWL